MSIEPFSNSVKATSTLGVVSQCPEPERLMNNTLHDTDFGGKVHFCGGRKPENKEKSP